ncbi:hypothetical protein [Mucilaginibacter sp.]|uniref:hypothetical protein n=1 Tax=Mucilaginibacter sp. TaxID=1882438 RepID=UPI002622F516|nr:hypothetical protein [Mucilaginibacter sp.]MDB4924376.1 TonB family protein [Mucilaginibacter sp.]
MKTRILLIVFLFSVKAFAQTIRVTDRNQETGIKEQYYVLKADKKIREGKYESYIMFTDKLICEGNYKNNLKDGLWTYSDWKGGVLDSGRYQQGKKVGIWSGYNYKYELVIQYDYTNNKIVLYVPSATAAAAIYGVINGADTIKTHLEPPPYIFRGQWPVYEYVST